VIRRMLGTKLGHGQCAMTMLGDSGELHTVSLAESVAVRMAPGSYAASDAYDTEDQAEADTVVLIIRHCQDEEYNIPGREVANKFQQWHSEELRSVNHTIGTCRDPCLTEMGLLAASTGIDDEALRLELNKQGYGGRKGGLQALLESFQPEVVLSSPISRALQTAMCAAANLEVPIVCLATLREISKAPKPGTTGITRSALQSALASMPEGAKVDLSQLDEVWCDLEEPREVTVANICAIPDMLKGRPEKRIAVISHGGLCKKLLKAEMGHGQYVVAEVTSDARILITEWSPGVQPYVSAHE